MNYTRQRAQTKGAPKIAGVLVILWLMLFTLHNQAEASPTIVCDFAGEWAYWQASTEFRSYVSQINGQSWEILDDQDTRLATRTELVIIGDSSANAVAAWLESNGLIDFSVLPADSDGFLIKSISYNGTNYLLLAGRKGYSTLYAVYDYFEKFCGVGYFIDGDSVPAGVNIPLTGINVSEAPRFEYRQLNPTGGHHGHTRYLTHFWKLDDWRKFIDQAVKRKVNLMPYDTSMYNKEVLGGVYEEATGGSFTADWVQAGGVTYDDFNDASINPAKWSTDGTVTEVGELTAGSSRAVSTQTYLYQSYTIRAKVQSTMLLGLYNGSTDAKIYFYRSATEAIVRTSNDSGSGDTTTNIAFPADADTVFHSYSATWTSTEVRFSIDGNVVAVHTTNIPSGSLNIFLWGFEPGGSVAADWVQAGGTTYDDFDDASINPAKWSTVGTVLEIGELTGRSSKAVSTQTFLYQSCTIRAKVQSPMLLGFYEGSTDAKIYFHMSNTESIVRTSNGSGSGDTTTNIAFPADADTAFHNYGVTWTSTQVRFFIDGQLIAVHSTNIPSRSLNIFLWGSEGSAPVYYWPKEYRRQLTQDIFNYGRARGVNFMYNYVYQDVERDTQLIQGMVNAFGTDHMYHISATEQDEAGKLQNLLDAYNICKAVDPEAQVVYDLWDLYWWYGSQRGINFINSLPTDMYLSDIVGSWGGTYEKFNYYGGRKWATGALHELVPEGTLQGNVDTYIDQIRKIINDPQAADCTGLFEVSELVHQNQLIYYLITKLAWDPTSVNDPGFKEAFLADYVNRRYGGSQNMLESVRKLSEMKRLEADGYNMSFTQPIYARLLRLDAFTHAMNFRRMKLSEHISPLYEALQYALMEKDQLGVNALYENYLVDLARTYIAELVNHHTMDLYDAYVNATLCFQQGTDASSYIALFEEKAAHLDAIMPEQEKILSNRTDFSLIDMLNTINAVPGASSQLTTEVKGYYWYLYGYTRNDVFEPLHHIYHSELDAYVQELRTRLAEHNTTLITSSAMPTRLVPIFDQIKNDFMNNPIDVPKYQGTTVAAIAEAFENLKAHRWPQTPTPYNIALLGTASSPDGNPPLDDMVPDDWDVSHLNDGDLFTCWSKADGGTEYIVQIDFPSPQTVDRMSLVGNSHGSLVPKSFDIYADGQKIATKYNIQYVENYYETDFPRTTCSTIRLRIFQYYGASPRIREWGLYDSQFSRGELTDVKNLPDGTMVTVDVTKAVTVDSGTFVDGSYYIEDLDRVTGIKVIPGQGVPATDVGDRVTLDGVMDTDADGERVLQIVQFTSQTAGDPLGALGVSSKSVFLGLPPVSSLLARTWGQVTYAYDVGGERYVYVDDGSGMADGSGHIGIRVVLSGTNAVISLPAVDQYVGVTGIVGFASTIAGPVSAIRPRSQTDVTVM